MSGADERLRALRSAQEVAAAIRGGYLDRVSGAVGVIGAAGQTGRALLPALAARGQPGMALIHDAARAGDVIAAGAAGTRLIEVDAAPESIAPALEGLDAVYFIPPVFNPREHELAANAIRASELASVERFVLHSVLHPWTPGLPHHLRKAAAEAHLRASSLVWSVLRPAMYAQTVLFYLRPDSDEVEMPYSLSAPFTVIDLHDVGEAAAALLLEGGQAYASYDLAGPELLTMHELVQQAGDVLGRPLVAREVQSWERAAPPGWSREQYATLAAMWSHYDLHGLVGHPGAARQLLGREPSSFREAIARNAVLASG
jgi:NAD(P)H dehydrogenase (quinone)